MLIVDALETYCCDIKRWYRLQVWSGRDQAANGLAKYAGSCADVLDAVWAGAYDYDLLDIASVASDWLDENPS